MTIYTPKTKKINQRVYDFITDAGHGWLKVRMSELKELGIYDDISLYSYQDHLGYAYLEEDCDASIFIRAKKNVGQSVKLNHVRGGDWSSVRNYQSFA
jgi:hypothetical protein